MARQNQHRNLNRNCIAVGDEFWQFLLRQVCFVPRDLWEESQAIAGYNINININFGPARVAQRHHLRGTLHQSGDQPFESVKVASIGTVAMPERILPITLARSFAFDREYSYLYET